jgi:ATP-dependent Clp protease protease subunit
MKYIIPLTILASLSIIFIFGGKSISQELDTSLPTLHRDIYLRGEINEAMAFKIREEIAELNEQGTEEITLHITSPGGEVYAGIQIYDYMMESKSPIRTSCEGMCMSMAAYLLASGTTRQSSAHASIMFHQVSSESKGHINEMLADIAETQRLQNTLNEMVGKRSGLTGEQLNKLEDHDNFISPQEAKSLNLIDTIIGVR